MYRCDYCGEQFNEPDVVKEKTGVSADIGGFGYMDEELSFGVCPYCGSEDFSNMNTCVCCGEPTDYADFVDGSDYCKDCYEDFEGVMAVAMDRFIQQTNCIEIDFLNLMEIYLDNKKG